MEKKLPLEGLRVIELGQLIAGPACGMMLSSFGAEVIKVEPPGKGDPMRVWRRMKDDTSLWWYSISRNKKSITLNLREKEGQDILKKLVSQDVDVLLENFRPGRMEEWGLGYEELSQINPKLVMARISGWGQSGPYAKRPGFASVAEGIGGLRYVTGDPGRPPIRSSISLGDTVAGLYGVIGIMNALYHRDINGGKGQVVDVAIYESVFNLMESLLPEYDYDGHVRERTGSSLPGIVPSNTYECKDGKYVIIGGNNDSIFNRLMLAIGRQDMADDVELKSNPGRVKHVEKIDAAILAWTREHNLPEVLEALHNAEVPAGPIYSIEDIAKDPQYLARGMFESAKLPDGDQLKVPLATPQLSDTPSRVKWAGPKLGEHNQDVYRELLDLEESDLKSLSEKGII